MKKAAPPLLAACLCPALILATGCMGYKLTPEKPQSMPQSSGAPLPLRVGLVLDQQSLPPGMASGGSERSRYLLQRAGVDFGSRFAQALRGSRLFQEVRYPLPLSRSAMESTDLTLTARFGYKFVNDPMQALKIVAVTFTGYFTGAFMHETSHHMAEAALSVEDRSGKEVKSYDESVDVEARSMVSMFAEMKTQKLGPPAAVDNLIAKLVQALIADRALLERAKEAPAAAPAAETRPEPQAAPAEAVPVETAAAVQAPPPAPAQERKPLTTYDDQLIP